MTRPQLQMAKRRRRNDNRLITALLAAFGVLALATGVLAFIVVRGLVFPDSISVPPTPDPSGVGKTLATPAGTEFVVPLQEENAGPTPQAWDGASRVNILIMGLDYRDWEAGQGPSRTDSMILLSLDPVTKTAAMLSVPRDMWVNIPGFDYGKLNTAYFLGEAYKLPGGGPGLAVKTIEEFLGVPIQFYAQIDFYAFVKFIDELECLDLNVEQDIDIGRIGEPGIKHLKPGVQCLDGKDVLGYARERHTEGDDFSRSRRQQQVIMAIREQILTFNMLPTLIAKAPALYKDLSAGIRTNLNLQQIIQLALSASQVPEQNIRRASITPDMVYSGTSPDGLSILIPIPDEIRVLRDDVFSSGPAIAPVAAAATNPAETVDPALLMKDEKARITVQNGTSTGGLAGKTAEYLRSLGMNVVEETNADQVYGATTLTVVNGKPYTIKYLAELMKVDSNNIVNRFDPNAGSDVIVTIGENWAAENPMP